jgi:hypothetical protein
MPTVSLHRGRSPFRTTDQYISTSTLSLDLPTSSSNRSVGAGICLHLQDDPSLRVCLTRDRTISSNDIADSYTNYTTATADLGTYIADREEDGISDYQPKGANPRLAHTVGVFAQVLFRNIY